MRPTKALLSTENLRHNVSVIRSLVDKSKVVAMVKANGYGHGIRSVALRIDDLVDGFGVSSIDEALILRSAGIKSDIILAEGVFDASEIVIAAENNFQIIINNHDQIEWIKNLPLLTRPIKIWIKIDTGLGRLGFISKNLSEIQSIFAKLSKNSNIDEEIVLISHFGCADDVHHPLNDKQIEEFNKVSDFLHKNKFAFLKSFTASSSIINFPQCHHDIVRPGLLIYGISPIANKSIIDIGLKPVMQLETQILTIKTIQSGDSIGYGATYVCNKNTKIAVIPIGYGDGYSRTFRANTPVLINNQICSIIGRVSMDMTTVDITNCESAKSGDRVVLWGWDLPVDSVARFSNCVSYDLVTGIQNRVKFQWI